MSESTTVRNEPAAAVRLAERLLAETREEMRRADGKAVQWLSMLGAGALGMIALWNTMPSPPWPSGPAVIWPALLGGGFAAVAAVAFTLVLIPRTGGAPDVREIAYFGHVYRIGDPVLVRRHLEEAVDDGLPGLVGQLHHLSRLVMFKYRCVRVGTLFGMVAAVLMLTASI